MPSQSQLKAVSSHRARLAERGLVRLEVTVPREDRELIRRTAKHLASKPQSADELRKALRSLIGEPEQEKGGIWEALRASPLVDEELDLRREETPLREVDL